MWKPIETYEHASKPYEDRIGEHVLLANGCTYAVGYPIYFYDEYGKPEFHMWTIGDGWEFHPTHWQRISPLQRHNA